jgi:HK97 family phage major capsid protein
MKLRELLEQRARMTAEMRTIADKPAGQNGDLSDEQETRFTALKGELAGIEKKIERQTFIDECERRANAQPVAGTGDERLDSAIEGFSLRRAILSQVPGHTEDCGREREMSQEIARRAGRPFQGIAIPTSIFQRRIEQRVMTTALPSAGPGSNLISTDHRGDFYIDALRAQMVIRRLGARVLTGLVGNVSIPKLSVSAATGWVAENVALTPSDAEHVSVTLQPKHCGGIVEFSRNLLMQTSPDIEQLMRNDFAQVLAREADKVAIMGGGSDEPEGILANSDVDKTTSFATVAWDKVLDLIALVEGADADANASAFLCNSKVVKKLRATAKVSSTDSVMIMESPRELAGYPLASSSLVPNDGNSPSAEQIIFGNFSDLLMGFWSELDILVNPYESTAYAKGNVQVRGMMTADIALRHAESFAASVDVGV